MINIVFFSKYREEFGAKGVKVDYQASCREVINVLTQQFPDRTRFLENKNLLVAVNQEMGDMDTPLKEGDEVAFFPPVTGG